MSRLFSEVCCKVVEDVVLRGVQYLVSLRRRLQEAHEDEASAYRRYVMLGTVSGIGKGYSELGESLSLQRLKLLLQPHIVQHSVTGESC